MHEVAILRDGARWMGVEPGWACMGFVEALRVRLPPPPPRRSEGGGGSTGAAQGRRLWGPGLLVRGESKAQDFGKGDIWVSAKRSVSHFSCTEFTPQHQVLFSTPCAAPTESFPSFGAVVQNGGFPADTIASRYTNVHAHPMSRAGWICLRVQSGTVDRAACVTIRHR